MAVRVVRNVSRRSDRLVDPVTKAVLHGIDETNGQRAGSRRHQLQAVCGRGLNQGEKRTACSIAQTVTTAMRREGRDRERYS